MPLKKYKVDSTQSLNFTLQRMNALATAARGSLIVKEFATSSLTTPRLDSRALPSKIAAAIAAAVKARIKYVHDPVNLEFLQSPEKTIELGYGDCDDMGVLLAAALLAVGIPARFRAVGLPGDRRAGHVYVEALVEKNNWLALDPVRRPGDPKKLKTFQLQGVGKMETYGAYNYPGAIYLGKLNKAKIAAKKARTDAQSKKVLTLVPGTAPVAQGILAEKATADVKDARAIQTQIVRRQSLRHPDALTQVLTEIEALYGGVPMKLTLKPAKVNGLKHTTVTAEPVAGIQAGAVVSYKAYRQGRDIIIEPIQGEPTPGEKLAGLGYGFGATTKTPASTMTSASGQQEPATVEVMGKKIKISDLVKANKEKIGAQVSDKLYKVTGGLLGKKAPKPKKYGPWKGYMSIPKDCPKWKEPNKKGKMVWAYLGPAAYKLWTKLRKPPVKLIGSAQIGAAPPGCKVLLKLAGKAKQKAFIQLNENDLTWARNYIPGFSASTESVSGQGAQIVADAAKEATLAGDDTRDAYGTDAEAEAAAAGETPPEMFQDSIEEKPSGGKMLLLGAGALALAYVMFK